MLGPAGSAQRVRQHPMCFNISGGDNCDTFDGESISDLREASTRSDCALHSEAEVAGLLLSIDLTGL